MTLAIDLVILAIIVANVGIGFKRGLTGSLLKIASFFIALIIAFLSYKPVANLVIANTNWDDNLQASIEQMLIGEVGEDGKVSEEQSSLPKEMVEYINQNIDKVVQEAKNEVVPTVATQITSTIIQAGSAIALFIIAKIILTIVSFLLKFITELPILKQVDKTGGIIYGLIAGLIFIWIVLAIISLFTPALENTGFIKAISESFIGGFLYNHNVLMTIIF